MNCIYLKQKLDRTLYCKQKKCTIKLSECANCPYKEYKKQQCSLNNNKLQNKIKMHNKSENNVYFSNKMHNKSQKTVQIKKRTSKLNKLERNRFSLFTDDDSKCMLCGSTYQLTWNEVFRGKNRKLSMQYGLCQRLCLDCHRKHQDDSVFNDIWHKKGQEAFNKKYPDLDFQKIFGRNYLDK